MSKKRGQEKIKGQQRALTFFISLKGRMTPPFFLKKKQQMIIKNFSTQSSSRTHDLEDVSHTYQLNHCTRLLQNNLKDIFKALHCLNEQ